MFLVGQVLAIDRSICDFLVFSINRWIGTLLPPTFGIGELLFIYYKNYYNPKK